MSKICYACKTEKPLSDFYPNNQKADGLSTYCKPCFRAKQSSYAPRQMAADEAHPTGQKHCSKCGGDHPLSLFGKNKTTRDGLQHFCKPCSVAAVTASRHKDPTSHRASSKRWREANIERHADNNARWKYGVEHGTYDQMFRDQGGKCGICGTDAPGGRSVRFHIDHCHGTGTVRGLLCNNCNTGIGQLKHDVKILQSAIRYLSTERG